MNKHACVLLLAACAGVWLSVAPGQARQAKPFTQLNDLDAFMAMVL